MSREYSFTITLQAEPEGGYTVRVPALPEVVTCGETYDEAIAMAREAIGLMIEVYKDEGWAIPDESGTRIDHLTVAA